MIITLCFSLSWYYAKVNIGIELDPYGSSGNAKVVAFDVRLVVW